MADERPQRVFERAGGREHLGANKTRPDARARGDGLGQPEPDGAVQHVRPGVVAGDGPVRLLAVQRRSPRWGQSDLLRQPARSSRGQPRRAACGLEHRDHRALLCEMGPGPMDRLPGRQHSCGAWVAAEQQLAVQQQPVPGEQHPEHPGAGRVHPTGMHRPVRQFSVAITERRVGHASQVGGVRRCLPQRPEGRLRSDGGADRRSDAMPAEQNCMSGRAIDRRVSGRVGRDPAPQRC